MCALISANRGAASGVCFFLDGMYIHGSLADCGAWFWWLAVGNWRLSAVCHRARWPPPGVPLGTRKCEITDDRVSYSTRSDTTHCNFVTRTIRHTVPRESESRCTASSNRDCRIHLNHPRNSHHSVSSLRFLHCNFVVKQRALAASQDCLF